MEVKTLCFDDWINETVIFIKKGEKYLHVSILLHILQISLLHHHHMVGQLRRIIWNRQISFPEIIIRIWGNPPIVVHEGGQIILHFHVMVLIVLPCLWSRRFRDSFGLRRGLGDDPSAKSVGVRVGSGLRLHSPCWRADKMHGMSYLTLICPENIF